MQKRHHLNPTMTEGSLPRNMLLISLPLMASNVLQVLFNMSDIAVVGQFAGSHALGSVGSTAMFVTLLTGILIGMGSGINIIVARFLGARKDRDVAESVHTAFLLAFFVGLAMFALGFFGARPILALLGTKDILLDGAIRYLQIYSLGLPAAALYNWGNAVFSAAGDTRKPLYVLFAAGVLNVVLNLFFVIVCHLAEAGVAIASAASQWLSALLLLFLLCRTDAAYRFHFRELRLHADKVKLILPLGLAAGAQNAIFATANLFIQAGVNTFDAVIVEGTAAAANADSLVYDVMAAIYTACSSFMSQNYGAGKRKRVLHSYLIALAYSFGIGAIFGVSLALFGRGFLSIFATDAAVIEAGLTRLQLMGVCYAFSAFMDCTIAASRGLGKSVVPTIIVILGSCVFRVLWVYTVFAYFNTIMSLYLVYIFSWTLTALAEIIYFVHIYKQTTKRFAASEAA